MKILIVIDMQNDFISGVLGTKEAQAIVPNVVRKTKEAVLNGQKVHFTVDTHWSETYGETEEGKNLPIPHCIVGTNGIRVAPEVSKILQTHPAKTPEFKMYEKTTFGSMEMAVALCTRNDREQIDEVELVGLCTDICVISNAMLAKAALPNAHIVVDAACCAGVTPERHDTALAAMKACQIEIRNQGKEPWRNMKGEN